MPEELTPLPCPFCGGPIVEPLFTYYAQCSNCGCEGPYQRGDSSPTMPADAIAAWNRRAQPAEKSMPERMQTVLGIVREERAAAPPAWPILSMFASSVANRKWQSLQIDGGYRMTGIKFANADRRGEIDAWGNVTWQADAAPSVAPTAPESEWSEPKLWAEIHRLRAALKGPAGFDTWQDAATDERIRRVRAERALAAPSVAPEPVAWTTLIEIDWVKRNAGRAGSFYAVKAGPNDIPLFANPPRAPLTPERIDGMIERTHFDRRYVKCASDRVCLDWYRLGIRDAEQEHGIRGQG